MNCTCGNHIKEIDELCPSCQNEYMEMVDEQNEQIEQAIFESDMESDEYQPTI